MAIDRNITININDTSPLANTAYVDAGKENKVYNKAQVNELVEDLREGTLGSISPSQTLQQLNALPDGNYYASEAGNYAFGTNVPAGWQFRFNKTGTTWKVLTKVQIPMQDLTDINNKIKNLEVGNVDIELEFTNGSFYTQDGVLVNSNGYYCSDKYFTTQGIEFKSDFQGVGSAIRAVFWDKTGNVIEFVPVGNADNIITPENAYMVAFNKQYDMQKVTSSTIFWSLQLSEANKIDFNNQISILNNENTIFTENINTLNKEIDEIKNKDYPYIIDIGNILKSYGSGGELLSPINEYDVVRTSDYIITGDFTTANEHPFSVTLMDENGKYHIVSVIKKTDNTLESSDILPLNFSKMMTTQGDSQHLSRYGYKALAQYVIEKTKRFSKRKIKMFSALSQNCTPYVKDWIKDGQTIITIERLPNTAIGGWLNQSLGIIGDCSMGANESAPQTGRMFKNGYNIKQNTPDKGVKFNLSVGGYKGYLQLNVGEKIYNESEINIIVKNQNGNILFNENVRGVNKYIYVDFDLYTNNLEITIKTLSTNLTLFSVNSVEVFKTYATDDFVFKKSHKAMFVMDSWGEFPLLQSGETGFTNPLGVTMAGLGYFPKFYGDYLNEQGFNVEIKNYSFGGRTVKWADYWINTFLENESDLPEFVFVNFAINDSNSRNYINEVGTNYDFDPEQPYVIKYENNGGIKGAITLQQHIDFYKKLINKIYKKGSTPVLLINPLLSGLSFGLIEILYEHLNTDFKKD